MKRGFELAGTRSSVSVMAGDGPNKVVEIDGATHEVGVRDLGGGDYVITVDGAAHRVRLAQEGDSVFVHLDGRTWKADGLDPLQAASGAGGASSDTVTANMPGTVVSISCKQGDRVRKGDALLVIESMKLQTTVAAPRDGTVATCHVEAGGTFDKDVTLVTLESEESE